MVNTGIKMVFPEGHYGRIAPRSGLALLHGIQIGGAIIDPDYRGQIRVLLINSGDHDVEVRVVNNLYLFILYLLLKFRLLKA